MERQRPPEGQPPHGAHAMPAEAHKWHLPKWITVPATVLLVGLTASALWVRNRTLAKEADAASEIAAIQELVAQDSEGLRDRQPLWGEATPGRAFEHFNKAIAGALDHGNDHPNLVKMRLGKDLPPETIQELRARWWPLVAEMRRGARAKDALRPLDKDSEVPSVSCLLWARELVNLAVIQCHEAAEAGRPKEAVEISLDAATFGLDLVRSGLVIDQMIGGALLAITTSECWTETHLKLLDRPSLELLATGLKRLDDTLPPSIRLEQEVLYTDWMLAKHRKESDERSHEAFDERLQPSWKFGLSTDWMVADTLCFYADSARQLREAKDSVECSETIRSLEQSAIRSGNPLLETLYPGLSSAHRTISEVHAHLRLLRMSVEVHQGRVAETVQKPLADPLQEGPISVLAQNGTLILSTASDRIHRTVAVPAPR